MKRVSVAIDEQLLEQAVAVSGEKTYARTIDRALRELVRHTAARSIEAFAGSGVWQGSLSEMRRDNPAVVRHRSSQPRRQKG
jgi:Arc/MetJ family transcription regulator